MLSHVVLRIEYIDRINNWSLVYKKSLVAAEFGDCVFAWTSDFIRTHILLIAAVVIIYLATKVTKSLIIIRGCGAIVNRIGFLVVL
jgi:hypothetical protein